jgi:membrane protein
MIKRIINFIKTEIWIVDLSRYPKILAFLLRQLRIILMAWKGFRDNRISLRASALTFYTMLSIVPVAAMVFGISKGFGFEQRVERILREQFSKREEFQEVLEYVIDFAQNMLDNIKGGFIAGVGLVVLFWAVMKVLGNIENSFNAIWQIKKPRPFVRKFSDYLSMMLIAPVLFVLSSTITVYISNLAQSDSSYMQYLGPLLGFLVKSLPYILIFLLFTLLYVIMPNTKVFFKNGLYAGIIAGIIFQVTQWIYIHFQVGVSRYGAIYGSFLALPLFLVWLQLSWLIVLLGAEISFAYQNIEKYEFESEALKISSAKKRLLTLLVVHQIIRGFMEGNPPLTATGISHNLSIPIRLIRDILFDLQECGLIAETTTEYPKERAFLPAIDINRITISYVIEKLDMHGHDLSIGEESDYLKQFSVIQTDLFKAVEKSPANVLIKDI